MELTSAKITFRAVESAVKDQLCKGASFDDVINALNDYSRKMRPGIEHITRKNNVWSIGPGEENEYLGIAEAVQQYVHKVVLYAIANPQSVPFMHSSPGAGKDETDEA